jgi:transcriptional repressor NrdR
VYRNFASLEDFEGEIALLRAMPSSHSPATSKESNTPITEKNSTTSAPQSNKTLANLNN